VGDAVSRKLPTPNTLLRVWRIRSTGKTLGWVPAEPNAESALKAAIEKFQVNKAQQNE
jgi:hypothetical protein